jgi:hypothetical protein
MSTPDRADRPVCTWATATYPLLVIRLSLGMHHLRPLPADLSRDLLIAFAWAAMDACKRRFLMCLVFSQHEALHLFTDGRMSPSRKPPLGGFTPTFHRPELDFLPVPGDGDARKGPGEAGRRRSEKRERKR